MKRQYCFKENSRNGGNLSYRVKPEEVEYVRRHFVPRDWQPIGAGVPELAGDYFLVTGSGKYFRNVIIDPEDSIGMIEIDDKGEQYRILWASLITDDQPANCLLIL